MTMRTGLLALLSVLIVLLCVGVVLLPPTTLPFNAKLNPTESSLVVLPRSDIPLPPGLETGDRLRLSDMDRPTRIVFLAQGNPPAGSTLELTAMRGDKSFKIPVKFVRVPLTGTNLITVISAIALVTLVTALGLLLLWRGRNMAATGVATWCFAFLAGSTLNALPLPIPYACLTSYAGTIIENIGTVMGLFWVADGLTRSPVLEMIARARRRRIRFHLVIAAYLACAIIYCLYVYFTGAANYVVGICAISLHFWAFAYPLFMLVFNYRAAVASNQIRIRWVLFSVSTLILSYIFAENMIDLSAVVSNLLQTAFATAAFIGFAYAILRHRLISLEFVLNRALVYGLITSLIVGIFAALLSLLERIALSSETNRFLALLIPLLLGMGLNTIKHTMDTYINKLFFRHRRRSEAALAQFARTCAFIDDPERLLDLVADEIHQNSGAQSLAVYLTQIKIPGASMVRLRGTTDFPTDIDSNDLALLSLRAGDAEVDLHGTRSALGTDGYAYAITVRGVLSGIVVCSLRPAEAYSLEERRLFSLVAHQAGVALQAHKLQEQQRLLQDVANGTYSSLPEIRTRAQSLLGS